MYSFMNGLKRSGIRTFIVPFCFETCVEINPAQKKLLFIAVSDFRTTLQIHL